MIDLVKKLKSQIGDDVCEIYSHEALFSEAAAEITRLRAALADAQARSYTLAVAIMGGEDAPGLADATDAESLADQLGKERAARDGWTDACVKAATADAQAVGFAAGVEAAAKRCDAIAGNTADFNQYHRRAAGQCGAAIRALTPPDATAAAARVLLPGMEQRHIDHMTSLGRDPEKYTSEYRMAAKALRAIAGDTP